MIRFVTTLTIALTLAAPAHAEDSDNGGKESESYWELAFAGGMLMPLSGMTEEHQQSLAGNVRFGWVSSLGLGLDLAIDYSPLSRRQLDPEEVYEVHFATAGLLPRFTLGKHILRLWLAAGGGMTYEQIAHISTRGIAGLEPTVRRFSAAGMGAAGLELHAFSGVGLAVTGSYTHTYGEVAYQLVNVTGGLAVTFQ